MKKMLLLGIAAVALVAAVPAHAALNFGGATGIVNSPTADTVAPMTVVFAGDYVNSDPFVVPLRLELGIMEGLEVGATYWYWDADAVDGTFGGNAKFALPLEVLEGLKIAVGGHYLMTKTDADDLSTIDVYGVASYGMELEGIMLQASGGADWERMSNGDSENGIGFFASLEVGILEGLGVAGEFTSDHGDIKDDSTSILVRYALPMLGGLTLQAGLTEVGDDHEIFAGGQFAFNFGM